MDVEGRRQFWDAMRGFAKQGKTIIFATHYLEEADAFADRIVLMARGQIVADGATTEIKARVGRRNLRFTLPGASLDALSALPGVASADVRGEAVLLTCSASDVALRPSWPPTRMRRTSSSVAPVSRTRSWSSPPIPMTTRSGASHEQPDLHGL